MPKLCWPSFCFYQSSSPLVPKTSTDSITERNFIKEVFPPRTREGKGLKSGKTRYGSFLTHASPGFYQESVKSRLQKPASSRTFYAILTNACQMPLSCPQLLTMYIITGILYDSFFTNELLTLSTSFRCPRGSRSGPVDASLRSCNS